VNCGPEELLVVRVGEYLRKQPYRCHADGSIRDQVEDGRPLRRHAGGADPVVGGIFRKVQRLRAVGEQRRVPFAEVQPAGIELRERRDQRRGGVPLLSREHRDARDELIVS
jgi:hypothetical protein